MDTDQNSSIDLMSISFDLCIGNRVVIQHSLEVGPVGRKMWKQDSFNSLPIENRHICSRTEYKGTDGFVLIFQRHSSLCSSTCHQKINCIISLSTQIISVYCLCIQVIIAVIRRESIVHCFPCLVIELSIFYLFANIVCTIQICSIYLIIWSIWMIIIANFKSNHIKRYSLLYCPRSEKRKQLPLLDQIDIHCFG